MGILEPTLGLASHRLSIEGGMGMPGRDDDDADYDDGGEDGMRRLMEKDACLTPEFGASIRLYLSTLSSLPWLIITTEQINAHRTGNSMRPSSYLSKATTTAGTPAANCPRDASSRSTHSRRGIRCYTSLSDQTTTIVAGTGTMMWSDLVV